MILRTANGSSEVIDFREEAGKAADPNMFAKDPQLAQTSGLSIGIPGEIRGFEIAHQRHGKLPWEDLFQASIKLAENGWKIDKQLSTRMKPILPLISQSKALQDIFAPNGTVLTLGDTIRRVRYAKSLRQIAKNGANEFYKGAISEHLLNTIQEHNGTLTRYDFESYRARVRKPLVGYYRGRKVLTCPLPASGPVLISALNLLEGFPLETEGKTIVNLHRTVETFKFVYAQRSYYGDPMDNDFSNISTIMERFIHKETAYENRSKMSDAHTLPLKDYGALFDDPESHGTMHMSALGPDGSAVSLTSTVNLGFGSKIIDYETGIVLNNPMDDFSIPGHPNAFGYAPSPYNYVKPGKKPLSSAVPTIIEKNGKVELVIGASGGSRIITSTLQSVVNVLDYGQDIFTAIADRERMHHQLIPNRIDVESEFPVEKQKELISRGHEVNRLAAGVYFSGVSGVHRPDESMIQGASDPRKDGGASGF